MDTRRRLGAPIFMLALSHTILVHKLQTCCKYYAVAYLSVKQYVARLDAQNAEKQIFATEVSFSR